MKSLKEIYADLREIRYYYSKREVFENGPVQSSLREKVERYNQAMRTLLQDYTICIFRCIYRIILRRRFPMIGTFRRITSSSSTDYCVNICKKICKDEGVSWFPMSPHLFLKTSSLIPGLYLKILSFVPDVLLVI